MSTRSPAPRPIECATWAERVAGRDQFPLTVPVLLDAPKQMKEAVSAVLAGEYECGFYGEDLTVLDIGANVGAFSVWAHHRWPRSRIVAYEPQPGTFEMLKKNVRLLPDIQCINAAVFPTERGAIEFFSRYPSDGEAGVRECTIATFDPAQAGEVIRVPALHPKDLPPADIVKLDIEGAEADVLRHMDVSKATLILLEYQNQANRREIKCMLKDDFELVSEDEFSWDGLLPRSGYRSDLKGDKYGHLFFVRRGGEMLKFVPPSPSPAPGFGGRIRRRLRALLQI